MSDATSPTPDTSWKDRQLEHIGSRLQTSEGRRQLVGGCVRLLRRLVALTTLMYVTALLLHGGLMRWVGEHNIFFAFCLYLPPLLWYLPAFVLLPLCLLVWAWRTLLLSIVALAGSLLLFFGLRWKPEVRPPPAGAVNLVVLTNNRGQNMGQSLRPFKNEVKPDVMVFQESAGTAPRYLADPAYGEFKHGRDVGEFSLVSKYPILEAEMVTVAVTAVPRTSSETQEAQENINAAARFVLDVQGRSVVVYNVHLPTPRDTLRYYQRGVFLYGLIGLPGTPFEAKRKANQKGWDQRIEILQKLIERARQEKLPTLLAGDFNMPSPGWGYQSMVAAFGDAHATAGQGFGFSFPGETRNPLSFGGVWMRIDYLFFDRQHWQCLECVTERDRPSQHRSVAASFALLP